MFTKAIVRKPCKNMIKGLSTANLGLPDFQLALHQHNAYIRALEQCGLEVIILDADENFPDSCFVEDTAVIDEKMAIIDNPGASSRKGEERSIEAVLKQFYTKIEHITLGTLEGGDVMRVENVYYIGLSDRTNHAGAMQFIDIAQRYGFKANVVEVREMLHLKSGMNYIGDNTFLVREKLRNLPLFEESTKIFVNPKESYASNCLRVNNFVLIPKGFPLLHKNLQDHGFNLIPLDMREFQKLDGGLSCLSLRFLK